MGYSAEVVRGYGYRIWTEGLEYADPERALEPWRALDEKYYSTLGNLSLLYTGDSRVPMSNQSFILAITDSIGAGVLSGHAHRLMLKTLGR